MTREEAIEVYNGLINQKIKEAFEFFAPELAERGNTRMTRAINNMLPFIPDEAYTNNGVTKEDVLNWIEKQKSKDDEEKYLDDIKRDWFERGKKEVLTVPELYGLEKQKEQPKEELVYRLNGLMQDYIKESKDDEEKEHRFKCYQLFWDALEDASYFEQKEQKSISQEDFDAAKHEALWDEKIRKALVWHLKAGEDFVSNGVTKAECLAYLENQKEQKHPNGCFTCDEYKKGYEEGRRNGFTAGYNKAMKEVTEPYNPDDYEVVVEGDTTSLKRKEQKPVNDKAFEEWINDWWQHNKVNNPDSYDKGNEIQFDERGFKNFCRGIRNMYQQKPVEWSEEDEKMKERLITRLNWITYNTRTDTTSPNITFFNEIAWLKSLRPQYHGDVTMTEAYKMGFEAGKASSWKPSEHQMNILKAVKEYVGRGSGYWGEALGSLIEDLEKL